MALLFGAATSDWVNCGSGSSINNFATPSIILWVYPTFIGPSLGGRLAAKGSPGSGKRVWTLRDTGQLDFFVLTSGTIPTARSANSAGNILTINTWWCVAFTLSSGLVPRIYRGTLTTAMTEVSYVTQTTGTGTVTADGADLFRIGNNHEGVEAFQGRIAFVSYYNTELALVDIEHQRVRRHAHPNCRLFMHLGLRGSGLQPDESRYGNIGTVTGATVAPHVPLGPLFGRRAQVPEVRRRVYTPASRLIQQAIHRASRF